MDRNQCYRLTVENFWLRHWPPPLMRATVAMLARCEPQQQIVAVDNDVTT